MIRLLIKADKVIEKSGNLIRKRLSQMAPKTGSKGRKRGTAKKTQSDINLLVNNLIART